MVSIWKWIKNLDTFSSPYYFKVNHKDKNRSILGSILSIIGILGMLSYSIGILSITIRRKNPITSYIDYIIPKDNLNFTLDRDFEIAISIPKNNGSEIFYPVVNYCTQYYDNEKGLQTNEELVPLRKRKKIDFNDFDTNQRFKRDRNDSMYCLNRENFPEFKIAGDFANYNHTYLNIEFYTHNGNLTKDKYIMYKEFLSSLRPVVNIKDYRIEPNNFKNPIQRNLEEKQISLTFPFVKRYFCHLKRLMLKTDEGLFTKKVKVKEAIIIDDNIFYDVIEQIPDKVFIPSSNYGEDFFFINQTKLGEFKLICRDRELLYERRYKKISECLADIRGLWETVHFIVAFIFGPYFSYHKKNTLLKRLFKFDFEKNEGHENLLENKKEIKTNLETTDYLASNLKIKSNKVDKSNFQKSMQLCIDNLNAKDEKNSDEQCRKSRTKEGIEQIAENLSKKEFLELNTREYKRYLFKDKSVKLKKKDKTFLRTPLELNCLEEFRVSLNYCGLFNKCYYKGNKKLELYRQKCKSLNEYLEIPNVIYQLQDIEYLKQVLLTPEQLASYGFINEDVFDINGNSLINLEKNNRANYWKNSALKCLDFIEQNNEGKESSEIDKRIFGMIDDRMKGLDFEIDGKEKESSISY